MKRILGQGNLLSGRLLRIDALAMTFDTFRVSRRNDCRYCGDHVSFPGLVDYDDGCRAL